MKKTNEIHLAENYQKDMELAESIFNKMISEDFVNIEEKLNNQRK